MDNTKGCVLTIVNKKNQTYKVQTYLEISELTNETKQIIDEFINDNFKDVNSYNIILWERGN